MRYENLQYRVVRYLINHTEVNRKFTDLHMMRWVKSNVRWRAAQRALIRTVIGLVKIEGG